MPLSPMKLYHATKPENYHSIMEKGLIPYFPAVYLTPDLKVARMFGLLIFEVDTKDLDQNQLGTFREMLCDILKTDDFYHYCNIIPPKLLKLTEWRKAKE